MSIELPPLHVVAKIGPDFISGNPSIEIPVVTESSALARERILREHLELALGQRDLALARIVEVEAQRDYLVEEYERAVQCGKQGYLHCAMHLFNAIANARVDAIIAAREKRE